MNRPPLLPLEPSRWRVLQRIALSLRIVAYIGVSLGYLGAIIWVLIDVAVKVIGGSMVLPTALFQLLVDWVLLSAVFAIPYLALLGLARLILSRIPIEYRTQIRQ